jgi:predicted regulator of amino acid metabolism with ACT domain
VLYNNLDVPGQISRVTAVLSSHSINIASLNVARQYVGSPALSVIRCDSRIPARAVEEIKMLEGISGVSTVSF